MISLYRYLEEHDDRAEAIEADFRQYYRLSLTDSFWAGQLSPRECSNLVRNLPSDSRLMRLLDVRASWSTTDYLIADVFDMLQLQSWLYICAHVDEKKKPSKPTPIPRPGRESKTDADVPLITDVREIRARLAGGGVRTERLTPE